jgi:hypothetical protein
MASEAGILRVIEILRDAGCRAPEGWAGRKPSEIARSWSLLLTDMDDEELGAAAVAWARGTSKEHQFWPMPGQLVELARPQGDAKAAVEALASADFALVRQMYSLAGSKSVERVSRDADRNARVMAALETVGGWTAWRRAASAEDDGFTLNALQRAWTNAYRAQVPQGHARALLEATTADDRAIRAAVEDWRERNTRASAALTDSRRNQKLLEARDRMANDPEARQAAEADLRALVRRP